MSLKRNITASYISQFYLALAGLLVTPIYIKYMGAEAYGLVGFFTMLQALFNILDMGLTPTIGRETARYFSGTTPALSFRKLYRALQSIFLTAAIFGALLLILTAEPIAKHWLHTEAISTETTENCVKIMAMIIALRWTTGLYRGVINGAEKIVWLSYFNVAVASSRFLFVLPIMYFFGYTPLVFFTYQLGVGVLETLILFLKAQHTLPSTKQLDEKIGWSLKPVKPALRFSLTIAALTIIWIAVTQIDKLILSNLLTLTEYGYFTLSVLVASTVTLISTPVSNALLPRMTRLHAEGLNEKMLNTYLQATQLVSLTACAAALMIACSAEPLLYAWTGANLLPPHSATMLKLYAAGNGLLALGAFPYYLQYALGNLRYHLIGNIILLLLIAPAFSMIAAYYGGVGAGFVWVCAQALYFFGWVPYVHSKLAPGFHRNWLLEGAIKPLTPFIVLSLTLGLLNLKFDSRIEAFMYLIVIGALYIGLFLLTRRRLSQTAYNQ